MSYRAWGTIIVVVALLIVGSLVFLQTSGSPRPSTYEDIGTELGSGRIERPEAGFAITTPPGWRAWAPSTDWQDWWGAGAVVHLWMEPASDAAEWWMGTCDIGEECDLERMVDAGGHAYCWVLDDTELAAEADWTSPALPAGKTASGLAEQQGWTEIGTAVEALPSGEASVVRAVDPNGWSQEMWYLTDGDRWYRLICGVLDSDVEPRAIAETLEFRPIPTAG
mgnify:FL=1